MAPPPLSMHMHVGTHGGHKRALYPVELELQVVVNNLIWVLGAKLKSLQEQCELLNMEPSIQSHK